MRLLAVAGTRVRRVGADRRVPAGREVRRAGHRRDAAGRAELLCADGHRGAGRIRHRRGGRDRRRRGVPPDRRGPGTAAARDRVPGRAAEILDAARPGRPGRSPARSSIINVALHKPVIDALLFSLAIAVGISPAATAVLLIVTKESSQIAPLRRLSKEKQEEMNQQGIKIKISRMAANKLLAFSVPLDLNRASAEDLCLIPGIGESLAQEMIAYRDRRKGFRSVEDLRNVKGIGEKKYQNLKGFFITEYKGIQN